jgi:hypothetical protein
MSVQPASLSSGQVKSALEFALSSSGLSSLELREFSGFGEGSLFVSIFQEGSVVVLWDGRSHVDINLFTFKEDIVLADTVLMLFKSKIPFLKTSLRDEQPRGFGRVVSYKADIEEWKGRHPHWASHLSK